MPLYLADVQAMSGRGKDQVMVDNKNVVAYIIRPPGRKGALPAMATVT